MPISTTPPSSATKAKGGEEPPYEFVQVQDPPAGTMMPASDALVSDDYAKRGTNENPPLLFTPIKFRNLTLRNRIMVSPMCEYSAKDGYPTDWHFVHLGSFAVRGVGLIMMEATGVLPNGRITPGCLGLWKDDHIPHFERIVKFAHSQGTPMGIQLAHAGRKASTHTPFAGRHSDLMVGADQGGWPDNVWGPSDEPYSPQDMPIPHAMTLAQIQELKDAFVAATRRADKAGFDVIEIHSAHGYLLSTFLSPSSNHRTDQYGGSFENRTRLLLETVAAVREVWGEERPLFVRVSATEWVEDGEGWDGDQTVELARRLQTHGVDLLDISTGGITPRQKIHPKPLYQVPFSAQVKKALPDFPTGTVGIITSGIDAEEILEKKQADMIVIGRAFMRNPNWVLDAAAQLGVYVKWPIQYERARPKLHYHSVP
ncbi:hypothetical protein IWQ60_011779 [Tieghemiomyces parasiticus]|uniref:NADH:flavin oxidoreductase/NADH oxidase N-terminal domain-containing protein n=1 Tax=Tieghemiomyces parasiticus TaxID=78921 RepID=A0A9W7ZMR8_9FUNG|nr:hypothetical protein IWQ60_011779 [Tieghemiomyces parasiticus]